MFKIKGKGGATIQQGDVWLLPIDGADPFRGKDATERGEAVLAYGEVTGHAHVIEGPRVRYTKDADVIADVRERYKHILDIGAFIEGVVEVGDGAKLRHGDRKTGEHPDHDAHDVPAGRYVAVRKRQYTPQAIIRVED